MFLHERHEKLDENLAGYFRALLYLMCQPRLKPD
jgi:hypothetical protein